LNESIEDSSSEEEESKTTKKDVAKRKTKPKPVPKVLSELPIESELSEED